MGLFYISMVFPTLDFRINGLTQHVIPCVLVPFT